MEHKEEDLKWKRIDAKYMSIGPINELMDEAKITKDDIGKYYVMNADGTSGQIMTSDEMHTLNEDEIGGWSRIDMFDVNC